MRIVLDLQACQSTGSRFRGIGRYSWALAAAMMKRASRHEFWVSLNAALPDSVQAIRKNLQGLIPPERIVEWSAPGPTASDNLNNAWRAASGEAIREAFIESLKPDFVHVTSLFEGFGDGALASVPSDASAGPVAVTLYDLIPLVHRKLYLRHPDARNFYYHCLDSLRRAHLLLAISDSTRKEAIDLLGVPSTRVVNISTAVDAMFVPQQISEVARKALFERTGLFRPFVMYTGGIDHRKNIEGLIRSYAALPMDVRRKHQLAVVCKAREPDRLRLLDLARSHGMAGDELVLTGFVSDADLVALYNLCDLFVFPSWHEGFGLPALEAMACGAAVVASNTSSLPEVVGRPDALFDPHKDSEISEMMAKALQDGAFRQALKDHGLARAKLFSWDESARRALETMEAVHQQRCLVERPKRSHKPRLAYVSPLPPERTGIADCSADLLPKLAEHYEIELISDQAETSASIPQRWPWRSCQWFDQNAARYDRVLYQFGNSSFHGHMFDLLSRHAGTVVLHDFYVGHICRHMETTGAQPRFWERALYRSHGYPALVDLREAAFPANEVVMQYPCNWDVLSQSNGVIVHSALCRDMTIAWYGKSAASRMVQVPLVRRPRTAMARESARQELGLPKRGFVTISLGILDPVKLCDRLVSAWSMSKLSQAPDSLLVFVGDSHDPAYAESLARLAFDLGIGELVRITGYVQRDTYDQYVAAADVVVQLRTRSRGETSAAILDGLAAGRCVIVNSHGSAAELPDDVVHKIPDEFSDGGLSSALDSYWGSEECRSELGDRAKAYVNEVHSPERVVEKYRDAIETFFASSARVRLGSACRDMVRRVAGLTPEPGDLERAAQSLADVVRPDVTQRQLCVDISQLMTSGEKQGHSETVLNLLSELLSAPAVGMRVEPVYAAPCQSGGVYRYARAFTARFLGLQNPPAEDDPLDVSDGDVFLGLDFARSVQLSCDSYLQNLQRLGMKIHFLTYADLDTSAGLAAAIVDWHGHGCTGDLPGLVRLDPLAWAMQKEQLFDAVASKQPLLASYARQSSGHYVPVRDARLRTLHGRRHDGALVSTGQAGCLMYGPYLRVSEGRYRMVLYGDVENAAGAHLDVVSAHGAKVHLEARLADATTGPDAAVRDDLLFSGNFVLDCDVEDLEVRVHVGAETVMRVLAFELISYHPEIPTSTTCVEMGIL